VPTEPSSLVRYLEFADPAPTRRVVLTWRRTFPRFEAIAALRNTVQACVLDGVNKIDHLRRPDGA
jgi:LysR family hydrogen peroxide-inducible transcriptional activator